MHIYIYIYIYIYIPIYTYTHTHIYPPKAPRLGRTLSMSSSMNFPALSMSTLSANPDPIKESYYDYVMVILCANQVILCVILSCCMLCYAIIHCSTYTMYYYMI